MNEKINIDADSLLAAIDLGSNSFRMEIGRYYGGQIQRVDYIKETVRQGGDLDEERNLKPEAIERGLKCLARFGERIKGFPKAHVRAVATQTLREARNQDYFIGLARKALGYDVEVISGVEEARLIYQGVSRYLPQSDEHRLVIDIGGRSTEFILGQQLEAQTTDSLRVGSVAWSIKYFPNGELTEQHFYRAEIAAESFLDSVAHIYHREHWDVAYGASGTIGAIADILVLHGYKEGQVTKKALDWLRAELVHAKHVDRLRLAGLRDDRKAVLGGGLCVLMAVFDILKIDTMQVAKGALRHGLLYDMVTEGMDGMSDMREASVKLLAERFSVDATQAANVRSTSIYLFDALASDLDLDTSEISTLKKMLTWAAQCHEIGLAISHTESHRHGAYILDNAELMGFSQSELHQLSLLVLGNHGKIKKLDLLTKDVGFIVILACLRLAVILCHSRNKPELRDIGLHLNENSIQLNVTQNWLRKFPQSAYLLEEEVISWQKTNWGFMIAISKDS
jgi:exopolyphosphatase/guanosine-5'-triphosphate,3'-diphosphate pyrophosphatase